MQLVAFLVERLRLLETRARAAAAATIRAQFLHLIRGEYEHDAIGVEYEAIGGHAWVFRDGRWQSRESGDRRV